MVADLLMTTPRSGNARGPRAASGSRGRKSDYWQIAYGSKPNVFLCSRESAAPTPGGLFVLTAIAWRSRPVPRPCKQCTCVCKLRNGLRHTVSGRGGERRGSASLAVHLPLHLLGPLRGLLLLRLLLLPDAQQPGRSGGAIENSTYRSLSASKRRSIRASFRPPT